MRLKPKIRNIARGGKHLDIEIRKLSADLLDDWLDYFDNVAFSDNDKWEGCYCMCYHWNEELQRKKKWNCTKADAPYNREYAIQFIKKDAFGGYLAYCEGKVVGWCNTNDKRAYDNVNYTFPMEEEEKNKKVKAIACFNVAPDFRGRGVATRLLERVCLDAAKEGYEYIEAYPFIDNANHAYHGPKSMYEKNRFTVYREESGCNIVRKYL